MTGNEADKGDPKFISSQIAAQDKGDSKFTSSQIAAQMLKQDSLKLQEEWKAQITTPVLKKLEERGNTSRPMTRKDWQLFEFIPGSLETAKDIKFQATRIDAICMYISESFLPVL